MQYNDLFVKENIDLDMLKGLNDDEYMDIFREIGISTWGHRHQLKKAVQCSINETVNKVTEGHELELDENVVENSKIEHDEHQIEISVHEIEEVQDNIEENDPIDRAVCNSTTQHVCSLCGKKVCQIFCSELHQ